MKGIISIVFIFLFLLSNKILFADASTLDLERQLLDADLIMQGQLLKSHAHKLSNGKVVTSHLFQFDYLFGVYDENFSSKKKQLEVFTEGGLWQGKTYASSLSADFRPSEKVLLLLKKEKEGIFLSHGPLGKYELFKDKKSGEITLKSSSSLVKISLKDFDAKLRKTPFAYYAFKKDDESEKSMAQNHGQASRGPASLKESSQAFESMRMNEELYFIGLFFFFIFCGVFHRAFLIKRKNRRV